jgi:CO/xanthine dehydrogenase Mo-binding subunit
VTASPSLGANPTLSTWLAFDRSGIVTARTGKSELGQGIATALVQVVADALHVDPGRVEMTAPTTLVSPDEGFTAGSLSVQHSGAALRQAALRVRGLFEEAAAVRLGSPVETVEDGTFTTAAGSVTYWELAGEVDLDVGFQAVDEAARRPTELIGSDLARIDLADKVLGRPRYLQDLRLPGQVFGRVLRPPYRGAALTGVDADAVRVLPGVISVVVDGSFVGVTADTEIHAREALAALQSAAAWAGDPVPLDTQEVADVVRSSPATDTEVVDPSGEPPESPAFTLRAQYSRPFLAHASIGTSAAAALVDEGRVQVWSHTQGVYPLRDDIARALGMPSESVDVHHVEGAGCYGHNPADDVAYDAVLLARSVPGRPVHVTWSREDELGWSPFGPAMVVEIDTGCSADGTITSWRWDGYGNGHSSRPGTLATPSLLAYADQAAGAAIPASGDPPVSTGAGTARNAVPGYRVGRLRATAHRLTTMPVRASALRSLGAHMNVFAIESQIDDLARHFGVDPVEYRLRHLDDPRGRAVIERVCELSSWTDRPAGEAAGRGLGFARYKGTGAWCAVVADVEAEEQVRLTRVWIAVDVGQAVNPDGVVNQIEGGAIQSASWTVKEQVRMTGGRVVSDSWEEYPILAFSEVPPIDVAIVDRPTEPSLGAGEASMGPTAAAIGNALMDAIGIRVRHLPLTAQHIVDAMDD